MPNFSVPRVIWSRGTFTSKISLMIDKVNDTSKDAVEKCLMIFNLEAGMSGEVPRSGGVV